MARKLISVPPVGGGSRGAKFVKNQVSTSVKVGSNPGRKVGPARCEAKRAAFKSGY